MIEYPCSNCPQCARMGDCVGQDEKTHIDLEDLKLQIKRTLRTLYDNDHDLLVRKVDERSITHRFALYFERENAQVYENNHFDIEYHRNGLEPKFYSDSHYARPDFIIHRRNCNKHNLIMMEFKTYWNGDEHNDSFKLRQFTSPDLDANLEYKRDLRPFNYSYGVHIILRLADASIAFFKNGGTVPFDADCFVKEAVLRG